MIHTNTKKILGFIILCNIIAVAVYGLIFWQIRVKNERSSQLANAIDLGAEKNSRLSALRKAVSDTEESRSKVASYFLSVDQTVQFIEQVEKLAKSNNLLITTSDVASTNAATPFPTLQLRVETTGSWSDTVNFVIALESMPYDIRVKDMLLSQYTAVATIENEKSKDKQPVTKSGWKNNMTFQVTEIK